MSAPMTIREIATQRKTQNAAKQALVLAEIKNAGDYGCTLMEITESLTGRSRPGSGEVGPVGYAIVNLCYRGDVEATDRFRGRTTVTIDLEGKSRQSVTHTGGTVWVATNREKVSR